MFKFTHIIIIIMIIALQFRLWSGEGSVPKIYELNNLIEKQSQNNNILKVRNLEMYAQLENLSNENESKEIEGIARNNLGLIKNDETFFIIVK